MIATRTLMDAAAEPHAALVEAAARTPLDARTPCAGWDLRGLLNHLLYWTPVLAAVGRRGDATPVAPAEGDVDLVTGDWPAALAAARAELVAAWREPAAWDGVVSMGGPEPFPAPVIGSMVLGELVVHGWDLARAVGEPVAWPSDVADAALAAIEGMAPMGRRMGAFGPAAPVAADAPVLDRVVALAGRDPGWLP